MSMFGPFVKCLFTVTDLGDPLAIEENGEVNSFYLHIMVCIPCTWVSCVPCTLGVMCHCTSDGCGFYLQYEVMNACFFS